MSHLLELRSAAALLDQVAAHVNAAIAALTAEPATDDVSIYRTRAKGPLTEAGIAEVERRLARGESNSTIALAMGITIKGVQDRRTMWNKKQKLQN